MPGVFLVPRVLRRRLRAGPVMLPANFDAGSVCERSSRAAAEQPGCWRQTDPLTEFPRRIPAAAGTIRSVTNVPDDSPSDDDAPSRPDWGACIAAHAAWLRKVILARTGEAQAVDEVFQRVALAAVEQ